LIVFGGLPEGLAQVLAYVTVRGCARPLLTGLR
jgi:hypothetical protein